MKKHAIFILLVLTFVTIISFAQDVIFEPGKENIGITQVTEAVGKLSKYMTMDEVKEQIGVPTQITGSIFRYLFFDRERLTLYFDNDKLLAAIDKNRTDLLAIKYTAKVIDYSILIDNTEMLTSNPLLIINNKQYILIEDFVELSKINIVFNTEKQQMEIRTDIPFIGYREISIQRGIKQAIGMGLTLNEINQKITNYSGVTQEEKNAGVTELKDAVGKININDMNRSEVIELIGYPTVDIGSGLSIPVYLFSSGEYITLSYGYEDKLHSVHNKNYLDLLSTEYTAIAEDYPVFIDGKELLISNPIVTIDKVTYLPIAHLNKTFVPIEDFAATLGIKANWNEEKQQLEITTK